MDQTGQKPPAEWLESLSEAGQWRRVVDLARESLQADASDQVAHYYFAWASIRLGEAASVGPSLKFLLDHDPENARYHQLAAIHHLESDRPTTAWNHACEAVRLEPENSICHHIAAIVAVRHQDYSRAKYHIIKARNLDPDNPDIVRLHIELSDLDDTSAARGWQKVHDLEKALQSDPEHEGLLISLGNTYLHQLELPRKAQECYQSALGIDPTDEDAQRGLWKAIHARSLLYRTLCLPASAGTWARQVLAESERQPARMLFMLICIKAWLAFGVWLLLGNIIFTPCAKCYEWLVLADIRRRSKMPLWADRWWYAWLRWPFPVRFLACVAVMIGFWVGLFTIFGIPTLTGLTVIAWFAGLHFLGVALMMLVRRVRSRYGQWSHARKQTHPAKPPSLAKAQARQVKPPPLPGAAK